MCFFLLAKAHPEKRGGLRGNVARGSVLVMLDGSEYWQCAFVIPKGAAADLSGKGIQHVRGAIATAAPDLDLSGPKSMDGLKLMSVTLDRLELQWRPRLLAIGDAAHAMSPIGGVSASIWPCRTPLPLPTSSLLRSPRPWGRPAAQQSAEAAHAADQGDPDRAEAGSGAGNRQAPRTRRSDHRRADDRQTAVPLPAAAPDTGTVYRPRHSPGARSPPGSPSSHSR